MSGETTGTVPIVTRTEAGLVADFTRDAPLYTFKVLAPEDWAAYADDLLHYPGLPSPQDALLVVVEEKLTGRLVATWFVANRVLLEGLYIVPDARAGFAVPKLLISGMLDLLTQLGIGAALTLAQEPSILALARKAGFEAIPGTLLKVTLPDP